MAQTTTAYLLTILEVGEAKIEVLAGLSFWQGLSRVTDGCHLAVSSHGTGE